MPVASQPEVGGGCDGTASRGDGELCVAPCGGTGSAARTGGRATTGPAGGFAAIAGACGGGAHDRRRLPRLRHNAAWSRLSRNAAGAGVTCAGRSAAGACAVATGAVAPGRRLGAAAGVRGQPEQARTRRRCGRLFLPLLDRLEHVAGLRNPRPVDLRFGGSGLDALTAGCATLPRWKCARTRWASSSSSELECVFFSVTPTRAERPE